MTPSLRSSSRCAAVVALAYLCTNVAVGQTVTIQDDITADTKWTADNTYLLDGLIFVNEGVDLTIDPGTVIKGLEQGSITTGDGASALIVRRGAKLYALGTRTKPIIFTSELDNVADAFDLTQRDRGLWGGLILLGRASTNQPTTDNQIEGIPGELDALYGGTDDNDDSGILRYVSIRHGGFSISGVEGDEINGLTMGAVGRRTVIEHVEVFANFDDCYEWFGGTVEIKYAVGAFCGDDSYDYDQGFRGKGQFWLSIHDTDIAGRSGEHDGGDAAGDDAEPFSIPLISNVTYIGAGQTAVVPGGDNNDRTFAIRDNAGGKYYNSIFTDFPNTAMNVEDKGAGSSQERLEVGDLVFNNNLFWGYGAGSDWASILEGDKIEPFVSTANAISNPGIASISRTQDSGLDPRPSASGPAASGAMTLEDEFFTDVDYRGAFDPGASLWTDGWTALYQNGFTVAPNTVVVQDDITTTTTWTAQNTYVLDGLIFVHEGAELTIRAGTVIKGLEQGSITTGDGASALVVRRGAKLFARGTHTQPIVFTSELDDVGDPNDLTQRDRGLWGGLILLGRATTNQPTTDNQIEGIPGELDARYGGTDDDDSSGELHYVSIRHGGFSISGVEGDEINGLTMGAVGRNTIIDHIEVFASFDDCYEWFGGTVRAKYLVGAFCGDDSYDYDQGFRGYGQHWFSIHDTDIAGRSGEHDGGDAGGDDAEPFSIPVISNVTYIGSGQTAVVPGGDNNDRTFAIRDNAGGKYYNSVFTDFPNTAMNVEDKGAGSSQERLEVGDLLFKNNMFWGYGIGATFADIIEGDKAEAFISPNNSITDPQIAGIQREASGGLDPRPEVGSPALSGADMSELDASWFDQVDHIGAFSQENWLMGWTALSDNGFLGNVSGVTIEPISGEIPDGFALHQNYPNPFNPVTTIEFDLAKAQNVRLAVYDLLGREVALLAEGEQPMGTYRVQFKADHLSSGVYVYRLQLEGSVMTRTMTLLK